MHLDVVGVPELAIDELRRARLLPQYPRLAAYRVAARSSISIVGNRLTPLFRY